MRLGFWLGFWLGLRLGLRLCFHLFTAIKPQQIAKAAVKTIGHCRKTPNILFINFNSNNCLFTVKIITTHSQFY